MCEYCTNKEGKKAILNGENIGFSLSENNPNVYVWGKDSKGWDISESIEFNFCPMCGRKLRKY